MSKFRNIRVPNELAEMLDALNSELLTRYTETGEGLENLPRPVDLERVEREDKLPTWVAIYKAYKDYQGHRERSRQSRTRRPSPPSLPTAETTKNP